MEKKIIEIQNKNKVDVANLLTFDQVEENPDFVKLTFEYGNINISEVGADFFSALQNLRTILEQIDICIICNGASKNVYPSPLMRNMGNGTKAYILTVGKKAKISDIVDIFENTINVEISSVHEQNIYYENWLKSVL